MKTKTGLFFLLGSFMLMSAPLQGQTYILWEDQSAILSPEGNNLLEAKLKENDILMAMSLDYAKRCDYYYTEFAKVINQATLNIYDCNRKVLGTKTWLGKFFTISEEERVMLLAFAIIEIIEEQSAEPEKKDKGGKTADGAAGQREFNIPFNHHSSRHFFAPTSYNLRAGEFYYSTLYFGMHDMQYGITDKFSIGMGTTVALNPFLVTPKYSFHIDEKNTVAVGSLFMLGTWSPDVLGNLGYVTYTRGNQFNNITFGLGHLYLENSSPYEGDRFFLNDFMLNLSVMARISDYLYFISENYYTGFKGYPTTHTAFYMGPDTSMTSQTFKLKHSYAIGMLGFRFINKEKNVSAWQFGLSYVLNFREPIPSDFNNESLWDIYDRTNYRKRLFLPTIGYVHKLGKRV